MSRRKTTTFALVSALLATCVAGAFSTASQAASVEELKKAGTVKIGYANENPFAFTETNGNVTGESPEIAKAIFKRLGIPNSSGVLTEWGSLIPGLTAGRFDVIAAGMYITPARCKQVIFTNPQYKIADSFLVAKGNPKGLHSYADIAKDPSLKLSMVAGSVYMKYAADAGIKEDQILLVPDSTAQLQSVRAGRADASVSTQLTIKGLAAKSPDKVEVLADFQDSPDHINYGALAFRPSDVALRDAFNAELKTWLGSEDHLKTVAPFGFDASNIPDKTAAEICDRP